jgi:hypothetical protein
MVYERWKKSREAPMQRAAEDPRFLKEFLLMSDKEFGLLAAGYAACVTVRAKNMFTQRRIRRWHLLMAGRVDTEHCGEIQQPVFLGGEVWHGFVRGESRSMRFGLRGQSSALLRGYLDVKL